MAFCRLVHGTVPDSLRITGYQWAYPVERSPSSTASSPRVSPPAPSLRDQPLSFGVVFLLTIGLIGTLGHYGSLGHSWHLLAGLVVVLLVLTSAWSGWRIGPKQPQMRRIHITSNLLLALGFLAVSWSGWTVVQKYLPPRS